MKLDWSSSALAGTCCVSIELCLLSHLSLVHVVQGIQEVLPEAAGGDHAPLPSGIAGCFLGCYIV